MKMSTAAKSRSGQVWIEMWLSASTSTPDTPPSGAEMVEMAVQDGRPGRLRRLAQRAVDRRRVGQVAGAPQIDQQMHAGELHAVLLDEIVLRHLDGRRSGSRSGVPRPSPVG